MKKIITILTLAFLCAANISAQDTLYVKPDASSDAWEGIEGVYTDLQSAIDAASEGDEIWVAAGTYTPSTTFTSSNDNRCKSFVLKSGITLYGGFDGTETSIDQRDNADGDWEFANVTTLSGDISNTPDVATDNSYHVVYGTSVSNIVIDGFTITGAYGDRQGYNEDQRGGGIYLGSTNGTISSNCEIRNCIITENVAFQQGGGAYMPKTCTMYNCLIDGNSTVSVSSAGGGVFFDNNDFATTVAANCMFTNNNCPATTSVGAIHYGGGAASAGNNCNFDHCVFLGNQSTNPGGAVYCGGGDKFEYCFFILNRASKGGAIFGNTSSSLLTSNCLFSNNVASAEAGCIYITGSSCRSVNCTFVGNQAPTNTVINGGGGYTVYNCILWNNGEDTGNLMPGNVVKKYTAAQGVQFPGTGNISATTEEFHFNQACDIVGISDNEDDLELIIDADYSMTGQSVCKDAGSVNTIDLSGYQFPEEDLFGDARINGGMIDLGCFEIQCEEESPIVGFTFLDTTYNADMPGTGTISATIYIENYDDFYTYYLTYNEEEIEMEDETYSLELNFPSAQTIGVRLVDEEECSLTTDTAIVIDSLFNETSGIDNYDSQNLFITPNPVSTQFTIHNLPGTLCNAQVEIYDGAGRMISCQNIVENDCQINVSNYQSGIYFVRLLNDGKLLGTSRIIKK